MKFIISCNSNVVTLLYVNDVPRIEVMMLNHKFSFELIKGTGIAANAESAQRFKDGQTEWLSFSEETINAAIDLLPKLTNEPHPIRKTMYFGKWEEMPPMLKSENELVPTKFGKLLLFLAKRRAEIAMKLKHGENDLDQEGHKGRTGEYGDIRFYSRKFSGNNMIESLNRENESVWPTQSEAVFRQIDSLLDIPMIKNEYGEYVSDSDANRPYRVCTEIEEGVLYYKISFKYKAPTELELEPNKYSDVTIVIDARVTAASKTQPPRADKIWIQYVNEDKYRHPGDMKIANFYLEKLLTWYPEDGLDIFMKNLGYLSQHAICLLPLRLGSAGTIEWMMRALAFNKGIILGDLSQTNRISWDFKALVTPDRAEYAEWFAKHAFNTVNHAPVLVEGSAKLKT